MRLTSCANQRWLQVIEFVGIDVCITGSALGFDEFIPVVANRPNRRWQNGESGLDVGTNIAASIVNNGRAGTEPFGPLVNTERLGGKKSVGADFLAGNGEDRG